MVGRKPHPEALENFESARVQESKIRYALREPNKRRPFAALGFSEEAGNWEELRDALVQGLPHQPARFNHGTEWGNTYYVDMPVTGPNGREAPVRTGWIYGHGEDFPRLTTLYIKTTQWRRSQREQS